MPLVASLRAAGTQGAQQAIVHLCMGRNVTSEGAEAPQRSFDLSESVSGPFSGGRVPWRSNPSLFTAWVQQHSQLLLLLRPGAPFCPAGGTPPELHGAGSLHGPVSSWPVRWDWQLVLGGAWALPGGTCHRPPKQLLSVATHPSLACSQGRRGGNLLHNPAVPLRQGTIHLVP